MKRGLVAAALIFLAAALVFLNQGLNKSAVPEHEEQEQSQQTPRQPSTPVDPNAILPPEETDGDPATAKHHIQVGWVYDADSQQRPETLAGPIQAIRDYVKQSGGTVSAEIVDLDVPLEDRSPAAQAVTDMGLHVDNQYMYGGNISSAPFPTDQIMHALDGAIKKK